MLSHDFETMVSCDTDWLASLVLMVIVSLMTAEPDKATQKMVDDVRVPSGKSILGKSH